MIVADERGIPITFTRSDEDNSVIYQYTGSLLELHDIIMITTGYIDAIYRYALSGVENSILHVNIQKDQNYGMVSIICLEGIITMLESSFVKIRDRCVTRFIPLVVECN